MEGTAEKSMYLDESGVSYRVASPDEQILNRVYDFPDGLPQKAMDILVDMASDEEVTNREMDFIYFQVITLPMMAKSHMFSDQKEWFLKENKCSFKDYIRYRLNKLNSMSGDGFDRKFCERIRQLMWRFTVA